MFAGLFLASISAATMRAALFQRKSRSGWLEELDGIREDALDEPENGVPPITEGVEDIWTDLRDGGSYADPHEISSLYATDATPDDPAKARAAAPKPKATPKAKAPKARPPADAPQPPVADLPLPPPPAPVLPPPPPPVAEPATATASNAPQPSVEQVIDEVWTSTQEGPAATSYDTDQIWVQPAPHPIRPSEMWHPAELAPPPLAEETNQPADVVGAAGTSPSEPDVATLLESELVAAADVTVAPPAPELPPLVPGGQPSALIAGPVGRKVRRDRPADRRLPTPDEVAGGGAPVDTVPVDPTPLDPAPADPVPVDRGEQSPLPTAPLPPAALPTRSNRLPGLESLPATPSSVVAPRPAGPFDQPPSAAALAPSPIPASPAEPAPVAEAPTPAPSPVPVRPAAAMPLEIAADGLAAVPGTIVRIGGARRASAKSLGASALVTLEEGWCWASPGEGAAAPLRIDLPNGRLTVEAGATALAVVEADRSAFVLIAAGRADLRRGTDGVPLERGAIVMVDASGAAQIDQATDGEIESDPIVAENLVLDAEL